MSDAFHVMGHVKVCPSSKQWVGDECIGAQFARLCKGQEADAPDKQQAAASNTMYHTCQEHDAEQVPSPVSESLDCESGSPSPVFSTPSNACVGPTMPKT